MARPPSAQEAFDYAAKVEGRVEKLEGVGERVAKIESDIKWHWWLGAGLISLIVFIGAVFGVQINNARTEVAKLVKEKLQEDAIETSRASAQQAAADAKKMRDSVAESLASAKEILEQAEKERKISVVSLDGIQGAAPGNTYTILRFKEGASGLAILSISTRFLPSVTSFVVPYCHYDHSKASPIYKDTEAIHSNFGEFTGPKTTGVLVLGAFGLSLDAVIENEEIRLRYRHEQNELTKAIQGKESEFFADVKVLLISDGPVPEVLTDLAKAKVGQELKEPPKQKATPPASNQNEGKVEPSGQKTST